ncbi:MAG: hypothetical protein RR690_09275 [Longicatena sp.]
MKKDISESEKWAEKRLGEVLEKDDFKRIGREHDYIFQALAFMGKASYNMSLANTVIDGEKRVPEDLKKQMKFINQQIHQLQQELEGN